MTREITSFSNGVYLSAEEVSVIHQEIAEILKGHLPDEAQTCEVIEFILNESIGKIRKARLTL